MPRLYVHFFVALIINERNMRICKFIFVLATLAACSLALAAETPQADKIIIVKSKRTMTLMSGDKALKTYRVSLGTVPVGPKEIQGEFASLGLLQWQADWTDGCVAVTNEEIDEIWRLVPVGTKVEIRP